LQQLTSRRPGRVTGELGIWIFILLDLTVFSLFFIATTYYRSRDPAAFDAGQAMLDPKLALVNTVVLVTGSLAAARAVHAVRLGNANIARKLLSGAALCGVVFAAIKIFEYQHLFGEGISINTSVFFLCYIGFTMVHLVHVVIGTVVLMSLAGLLPDRATLGAVECGALYWHMVDLLWLILFPLLYLT
jgi:nitric oxide reductase NorE protein